MPAATLQGVDAVRANDVWVVGQEDSQGLAMTWNGRAWIVRPGAGSLEVP